MHVLKICALLLITVFAMRLSSWILAWLLRKMRLSQTAAAITANVACFVGFVAWLYRERIPGLAFEWDAVAFGAFVWASCLALDLVAKRRKRKAMATGA